MMRVLEITVSRSRRVNLGNYEHEEGFVAAKVTPDSEEGMGALVDELFSLLDVYLLANLPKGVLGRAEEEYRARKAALAKKEEGK